MLKIFGFVNVGERAGSGVDKIMTAWEEQSWKKLIYNLDLKSERVTLQLEVGQVTYIPGAADLRSEVHAAATIALTELTKKERKILEYIEANGSITTQKVTEICDYKTKAGARKLLEKMVKNKLIQRTGSGPATKYKKQDDTIDTNSSINVPE